MIFLVDTNICTAHLRGDPNVRHQLRQHVAKVAISTVSVGEFRTWGLRKQAPVNRSAIIENFLSTLSFLPFDDEVAMQFEKLHAALLDMGRPTATMDLLIAATALHHGLTLVTNNTRDFAHIPGIALEDWLTP